MTPQPRPNRAKPTLAPAPATAQTAPKGRLNFLCPIPLEGGSVARIGAPVGLATCNAGKETLDDLLKRADTALYAAKREGKNTFREADASGV
ncbi:MAG: diguanylate cyclase [Xanthomonadaceae bacterium]|nr:diguanylate cyclase [Xanthomonadaceae bacterium]